MNRQKERDGMEEPTEHEGATPPIVLLQMPTYTCRIRKASKNEGRPSPMYKSDDGWVVDSRFGHLIGS